MFYDTLHFIHFFAALTAGIMCCVCLITDAPLKKKSVRELFFFASFFLLLAASTYLNFIGDISIIPEKDLTLWRLIPFMGAFASLMIFGLYALGATIGSVLFITSLALLAATGGMLVLRWEALLMPFVILGFPASVIAMCGLRKMAEESEESKHTLFLALCCAFGLYVLMFVMLLLGRVPNFPYSEQLAQVKGIFRIGAILSLISIAYIFYRSASGRSHFSAITIFLAWTCIFTLTSFTVADKSLNYGRELQLENDAANAREVIGVFNSGISRTMSLATLFSTAEVILKHLDDENSDPELRARSQNVFDNYKVYQPNVSVYLLDMNAYCVASTDKPAIADGIQFITQETLESCIISGQSVFAMDDPLGGDPGIYITKRIESGNASASGLLLVKLTREYFAEAFPNAMFFAFADDSKKIFISSERSLTGLKILNISPDSLTLTRPESSEPPILFNSGSGRFKDWLFLQTIALPLESTTPFLLLSARKDMLPTYAYLFGLNLLLASALVVLLAWSARIIFVRSRLLDSTGTNLRKAYFSDSMTGVMIINRDFSIVELNNRALSILGRQRQHCIGEQFKELAPQLRTAETARFSERLNALFTSGASSAGICYFSHSDEGGETACLYSLSRMNRMSMDGTENVFAVLVFMNISDFADRIKTLELAEKQMRSLTEAVNGHIFMLTPQGEFISTNDQALGAMIEKGLHPRLHDFFPVDAAVTFKTMLDNIGVMKNAITFEHTQEVFGSERVFSDTLFPIVNAKHLDSVGAVVVDITKQRRTEKALRDTEEKLWSIGEAPETAVWETDSANLITFCRQSFTSFQIPLGSDPFSYISPEDVEHIKSLATASVLSKKPFRKTALRLKMSSPDDVVHVIIAGVPFFDSNGTFKGFRGFCAGIEERMTLKEISEND